MAKYVKLTNGCVKVLVDITNTKEIESKLNIGFEAEKDSDGEVVTVNSDSLTSTENERVAAVLDMIKSKPKRGHK